MRKDVSIAEDIYLIGVNDRRTHLFENLWPLPQGVSYNSYLIVDEKTALLDTVEFGSEGSYVGRIEELLDGKPLDYLVVNHMEPDHSGEIESVIRRYPEVKILGNAQTRKILDAYYCIEGCGNFQEVANGEELSLGRHTLKFVYTPWVHWPETMMTYEVSEQILFSGDAFGTFGTANGTVTDSSEEVASYEDEMRRYYSNIVGKYGTMVQRALKSLDGIPVKTICSLHGPVWRGNASEVIKLYDKWSKGEADESVVVIYASMYNNTAHMADYIANGLAARGVKDVKVYDVSKTHLSYLISEIWRCKYVVLGSCAYNAGMFPMMNLLCNEMERYGLKGRDVAVFGSYSWSGGGAKMLNEFVGRIGWEKMCDSVEIQGRAVPGKLQPLDTIADAVAARVLK